MSKDMEFDWLQRPKKKKKIENVQEKCCKEFVEPEERLSTLTDVSQKIEDTKKQEVEKVVEFPNHINNTHGKREKPNHNQRKKTKRVSSMILFETIRYLCANDNVDVLREFVNIHQVDVLHYRRDIGRSSFFHISSGMGGVNITQYLLSRYGFDVNIRDKRQKSPLHLASRNGHLGIIQLLINNNADVNAKEDGGSSSPHNALLRGHIDVVQLLINNNADVNAKSDLGHSPLHLASSNGHIDIIQLLINKGADINVKDTYGRTPLDYVCEKDKLEIIQLFK